MTAVNDNLTYMFSLFNNKNRSSNSEKPKKWIALSEILQLDFIDNSSQEKNILIFKHSTRCIISKRILSGFTQKTADYQGDIYYLDLIAHRDISDEIARRYYVVHQSPQLLIISKGKASNHASHADILEIGI